jgi:hypothetical protein
MSVKSYRGPPMTLDNAAAAKVRLTVWCKECRYQVEPAISIRAHTWNGFLISARQKLMASTPTMGWALGEMTTPETVALVLETMKTLLMLLALSLAAEKLAVEAQILWTFIRAVVSTWRCVQRLSIAYNAGCIDTALSASWSKFARPPLGKVRNAAIVRRKRRRLTAKPKWRRRTQIREKLSIVGAAHEPAFKIDLTGFLIGRRESSFHRGRR